MEEIVPAELEEYAAASTDAMEGICFVERAMATGKYSFSQYPAIWSLVLVKITSLPSCRTRQVSWKTGARLGR